VAVAAERPAAEPPPARQEGLLAESAVDPAELEGVWAAWALVAKAAAVLKLAVALAARVPVGAPRTAVKGSRWLATTAR
jgi:hypothetical protein